MHEKEWGVIVDNCNSILFLGSVTHGDTLKYMSDLLGKGTFDKKTTGRTRGRHGTSSYNDDVIGRELMDPSEIRRLPKEDCLLIVGGRHPFYSKKYDYKSHPNYSMTSDGNETLSYEYTPQPIPTPDKKNLDKNLSHGEKEAGVVVPDKESVVEVKGIQYEEEQSLAENIRIMASIVKNAEMISDGSEAVSDEDYEEYLQEILNEQEKEIESITDALIVGSRLVEKTVKEAEEKIEVAPFAQGMQVFGRSFRNGISEIPVGFIIGQEIDDMSEEEQTELIKDVEEIYFDNDEPAETADNSMTADFQNALSDLNAALDIYDDDNILDELLAGNLSV
jgi:hypothetical protein